MTGPLPDPAAAELPADSPGTTAAPGAGPKAARGIAPAAPADTAPELAPEGSADGAREGPCQMVTLRLDGELFAIPADHVREIIDPQGFTRVPNASAFCDRLINVRGAVAPLADFRVVFGMERRAVDRDSRIVVVEIEIEGEPLVAGVLADKVEDVCELDQAEVAPPPRVGMRWPAEVIRGIARRDADFVVVPDLQRLFAAEPGPRAAAGPLRADASRGDCA